MQKGQINLVLLVLVIILLCIFLYIGLAVLSGNSSETRVKLGEFNKNDCSNKLNLLNSEYGLSTIEAELFLNGVDMYKLRFNEPWTLIFRGDNCKIVEDPTISSESFRLFRFQTAIKNIPEDYFRNTQRCIKNSEAKGMNNICSVTGLSNSILDFPVTTITAQIPTKDIGTIAKKISNNEKLTGITIAGSKAVKAINGSNIKLVLQFMEDSSCQLKNTPYLSIWHLAGHGHDTFKRAKNNEFYADTIPKLVSISDSIILFENIGVEIFEFELLPEPAPGDIVGTILNIIGNIWNFLVSSFNAGVKTVTYTITEVIEPQCTRESQITKYETFKQITLDTNYLTDYNKFETKLKKLKSEANQAINSRNQIYQKYRPEWHHWIALPIKSGTYTITQFTSQANYSNQLYKTAKKNAIKEQIELTKYWNNTQSNDWINTTIFWAVIMTIILFILKQIIEYFQKPKIPVITNQHII
jgi:hypothetical protein